jgi:hypothetical protein
VNGDYLNEVYHHYFRLKYSSLLEVLTPENDSVLPSLSEAADLACVVMRAIYCASEEGARQKLFLMIHRHGKEVVRKDQILISAYINFRLLHVTRTACVPTMIHSWSKKVGQNFELTFFDLHSLPINVIGIYVILLK